MTSDDNHSVGSDSDNEEDAGPAKDTDLSSTGNSEEGSESKSGKSRKSKSSEKQFVSKERYVVNL